MILTLNVGSSSIKARLFDDELNLISKHLKEEISADDKSAFSEIFDTMELDKIKVVAHRVVHGGEFYHDATIIDDEVKSNIAKLIELAPLHNGANLLGINTAQKLIPNALHVAIFDTAFHYHMPSYAYHYALPYEMYEKDKIRRYGFHGSSHKYVYNEALHVLGKKNAKVITCHLGNGSSVSAVKDSISIDTSMGFTPLEGLIMGTRCGDIDSAIIFFLQRKYPQLNVENVLNKKSGLKGIAANNDMRSIIENAKSGDKLSQLAIDMFCYRIAKYIGSYFIALGGADAIVFTGGIGENSSHIREQVSEMIKEALHVELDIDANEANSVVISTENSKLKLLCIKTNEELQMAKDAKVLKAEK